MAEFREDIANLVEALVVPLVDDPDAVEITSTDTEEGALLVEISVADEDAGKVIGRQGRGRTLLRFLALKQKKEDFLSNRRRVFLFC